MSDYIFVNGELCHADDELKHYGVLGMKWGRRKNPTKAYEKASKKLDKLNNKAEKAKMKYGNKSHMHLTDFGVRAENKARKKAARAEAKAIRWKRAMNKNFSAAKLTSLEKKYIDKGEAFTRKAYTIENVHKRTKYYDKGSAYYDKRKEVKALRERIHGN